MSSAYDPLPVKKTLEDLVFVINGMRQDYRITGNHLGNIVLIDPETNAFAGFINVRTTEVTLYGKEDHGQATEAHQGAAATGKQGG